MDPSTYRSLTFLFSLGALPIACTPEKNDTTDGGTGGGGTGTDSAGATTGTASVTDGGSGSAGATDSGGSGGTTSGTSGPTSTSAGETETGGPGGVCEAFADHVLECNPETTATKAEIITECEAQRTMFGAVNGPACLALYDVYEMCAATSPCDAADPCIAEIDVALSCLPEPGEVCKAFGTKYAECVPGYDAMMAAGYCQSYINFGTFTDGPACGTLVEELQACLSMLSCADLEMQTGCEAQQMAVNMNCGFGEGAPAGPGPRGRLVSR